MLYKINTYDQWLSSPVTLTHALVDTQVHVDANNNPSVVPQDILTGLTSFTGAASVAPPGIGTSWLLNGGNQWKTGGIYGYTAQALDSVTFTLSGIVFIQFQLTGVIASGQGASSGTVSADMISNGAIATITVTPTGGVAQNYSLDCYLATPQLSLYLSSGTTYTITIAHSGRWNVALGSSPAYTEIGIVGITTASSTTSGTAEVSVVIPSSYDAQTYWSVAWWTQSSPSDVGNVVVNGLSTTPTIIYQKYAGQYIGMVPINTRSSLLSLSLYFSAASSATQYWIRDITIHSWLPENDGLYAAQLGYPKGVTWGANMLALHTGIEIAMELSLQSALDLLASTSITTAVSPYIEQYGTDIGMVRYTGEPLASYRTRLKAFLAQDRSGTSLQGLAQQVFIMTGVMPVITSTGAMMISVACQSSLSYLVNNSQAKIPSSQVNSMISSLVETLLPAGVIVSAYTYT